ncbi:hypothetical protein N7528_002075 [Penicillium herquei]|nr:hypothetical protein N7528_002075 [Penicillium herquei]
MSRFKTWPTQEHVKSVFHGSFAREEADPPQRGDGNSLKSANTNPARVRNTAKWKTLVDVRSYQNQANMGVISDLKR